MSDGQLAGTAVRRVYAEDLRAGDRHELGSHRVSEEEILEFATAWDPQYFHVDAQASAEGPFGGLIASGVHTFAIFQKLVVTACFRDWNIIAGKEIRDLRFPRPVRPGDELTGHVVVEEVTLDERQRADLLVRGVLVNQEGKEVLTLALVALIRARG